MWPRHANDPDDPANGGTGGIVLYRDNKGLRHRLGDLHSVVALLAREPTTRQRTSPSGSPRTPGLTTRRRVPCSLGYHFTLRGGLLHVTYFIRSCDFLRYFRDDVYMAMRLGHGRCKLRRHTGRGRIEYVVRRHSGLLHMHIISSTSSRVTCRK